MPDLTDRRLSVTPHRLVRCGLALFFLGTALLLGAVAAQWLPWAGAWFVPGGALGYTAAATLVCWGVWALGAGLRQARAARVPARRR